MACQTTLKQVEDVEIYVSSGNLNLWKMAAVWVAAHEGLRIGSKRLGPLNFPSPHNTYRVSPRCVEFEIEIHAENAPVIYAKFACVRGQIAAIRTEPVVVCNLPACHLIQVFTWGGGFQPSFGSTAFP